MDEHSFQFPALHSSLKLVERMCVFEREFCNRRTTQRLKMRTTTSELAKIVRHRAQVCAGCDSSPERGARVFKRENFEFLNFNLHRAERHLLFFAGEFVRGHTLNLLR